MTGTDAKREAARVASEASAAVGETPLVRLRRLGEGLGAEVVAKLEYLNPGGSVKDRIGVAMIDAAERDGELEPGGDDRRADQRQHRDRPGAGLRRARLRARADPAGGDEPRADQAAALLRRRGPRDALAGRDGGGDRARTSGSSPSAARSCRSSSRTRRTPRSTAGRRRRRSGATPAARSTCSSTGVGTGGTITGVGQVLKERRPGVSRRRRRAGRLAGALRRRARPAQDPGDRRRLRPRGARPRGDRRGDHGRRRDRARRAARGGRGARACWSASPPARRSPPRSKSPRGPRWRASGSSRSPATAASATCRCHSSLRS